METLKFKALQKKSTKEDSRVIRIDATIYDTVTYISLRTGIPVARLANILLDCALRQSEIEGPNDGANVLEAYKLSESKYEQKGE